MREDFLPLVLASNEIGELQHKIVGGKAANLSRVEGLTGQVPRWYAITTEVFERTISASDELGGLLAQLATQKSDRSAIEGLSVRIGEAIRGLSIPEETQIDIARKHRGLFKKGTFVSVRSSAVDEDSENVSFAGLHESYLFLQELEQIYLAVKKVWSSLYSERAISYRLEQGLPLSGISIAVVVQQMVEAEISGVIFTANPANNNVQEMAISSLYGAGEGLVSAGLSADTFIVNKVSRSFVADLAEKSSKLVFDVDAGKGLKEVDVDPAQVEVASLNSEQIEELLTLGSTLERFYGRPQDIEFSYDKKGKLCLLQTRPITTVVEYGPAAGNRLIWDNSNIIESYSGVTSPMTFSFIKRAYTIVYHCFAEVMGISPKVVWQNRTTFENMLGLFRGQVYYNLLNWYRLVKLFPGFQFNKAFMESMMGLAQGVAFEEEKKASFLRRYVIEFPALLFLLLRTCKNFFWIKRSVRRFQRHFAKNYQRWTTMDFSAMPPDQLMQVYHDMENKLLWRWKAPIINDFYVMIFYGALKKLCSVWCGDTSNSLQNDLLCGDGDIESTEPTRLLIRLARKAKENDRLTRLILEESPDRLVSLVPQEADFAEFIAELNDYLDRYGFRCMNELKLEEYSLREKPQFLYQVLKNYLSQSDGGFLDLEAMEKREQGIRTAAEEKAFAAVSNQRFGGLKQLFFRRVLRNARLGVRNRENMRFARTKIYGVVRELLRALGAHFEKERVLQDREDIFYLSIDEVWDFVRGTALTTRLQELAALRKAEYCQYREKEDEFPDDHFETYGMAYHRNRFKDTEAIAESSSEDGLKGIGCCPGTVREKVKVIRSPHDDISLNGEILVAGRTDPGWVPLYPSVSGLLIERGSILSHSAIVAREMGIPTIVGIRNLLSLVESGDTVEMDGVTGIVKIDLP